MGTFLQQISSILVTSPGNLIYHIVLAFCLAASLQAALLSSRHSESAHSGRLILGLGVVLLAQFLLFGSSALAWQQVAETNRLTPPLDRAVTTFSIIWIVWLWAFPRRARAADTLVGSLSLVGIAGAVYTVSNWLLQPVETPFNGSIFDWYWELASLVIAGLGILVLVVARPAYWGVGLASLALLLGGYVANLLMFMPVGDYAGVVRLGQLTAYLMLPVLAQRLLPSHSPVAVQRPYVEDSQLIHNLPDMRQAQSWSAVVVEKNPDQRVVALAHAVAQSLHADLCFFLIPPQQGGLWRISGGYDLVAEEPLTAAEVEPERLPTLTNAMQRGKSIRLLPGDTGKNELVELGRLFGMDDAGSLLAVPLIDAGKVLGGIVLLSPYQVREWDEETQAFLGNLSENITHILHAPPPAASDPALQELNTLRAENQALNAQIGSLRQKKTDEDVESLLVVKQEAQTVIADLRAENEQLRAQIQAPSGGEAAQAHGPDDMQQLLSEAQATITRLQAENEQSRVRLDSLAGSEGDSSHVEGEFRLVLQELAVLRNQLAQANMDLEKARNQKAAPVAGVKRAPQDQDLLTSIAQDLRQPLTSILGYADLLLADTGGGLTSEQRTFLERIKSASERLRGMISDLVRAAAQTAGTLVLTSVPVDLEEVINEAFALNTGLLRENKVTLRMDVPDELPVIRGDPQAMQQIVMDLLRNAGMVSPQGGELLLRVMVENNNDRPSVLLQLMDSGGGLASEDLERIFQPQHKAGNALIEGNADAGNSLPVVEALVKAQGGQIWVETEPGKGASFNLRLPMHASENLSDQAGV